MPTAARGPRLFFALWLDAIEGKVLCDGAASWAQGEGRAALPVDLHLTLCFLGSPEPHLVQALCEQAGRLEARPFALELTRLEYWQGARVVVATPTDPSAGAVSLAAALRASARSLGLSPDEQPFSPHVTLRRGVPDRPALAAPLPLPNPLRLDARCFHLAQSQELPREAAAGLPVARYRRLASWPLGTALFR